MYRRDQEGNLKYPNTGRGSLRPRAVPAAVLAFHFEISGRATNNSNEGD